jgi:hypothetical protein
VDSRGDRRKDLSRDHADALHDANSMVALLAAILSGMADSLDAAHPVREAQP